MQNYNLKLKISARIRTILFFVVTIFCALYFIPSTIFAKDECSVDCDDNCAIYTDPSQNKACRDKCKSDEEDCRKLNKKAKVYENILKLNDKQQTALSNQIANISQEKQLTISGIQAVQDKIYRLNDEMEKLKRDISQKEKDIIQRKEILSGLMRSYYDYYQQGILGVVLLDDNLPHPFAQADYAEQSQIKVSQVLEDLQNDKEELTQKNSQLKKDYDKSLDLKKDLSDKKASLQLAQKQKQYLLVQTQGEEQKYKDLLAHIEEQKNELFNFGAASNIGDLLDSVSSYDRPDRDDWASTSWYYSQRDSRWGGKTIGNSHSFMRDYGCAVTAVSMVFRKLGANIDPGKLAKEKIFYYDLIKWPSSWTSGIELVSSVSHGNVNWSTIDKQIKKGNPVIVHIQKTNGRGGHYVVITGEDKKDYIVHDPYFGPNLYLGTSHSLVGKLGTKSGTKVDQMIIYND